MPSLEELEDYMANRKALEEEQAQAAYLAKKKADKKRRKRLQPALPTHAYYKVRQGRTKEDLKQTSRTLGEQRHYPVEEETCDPLRRGEGRQMVDEHLFINYSQHRPHTSLVCKDDATLVRGVDDECPVGEPFVLLRSAPHMKDNGLEFSDVARVSEMRVPVLCDINSDARHMSCARVEGSHFDKRMGLTEDMRQQALIEEGKMRQSGAYEYRKARLREQYGISICEVRL